MILLFVRAAKEEHGNIRTFSYQTPEQFNVVFDGPPPELEVFGFAGADMNPEQAFSSQARLPHGILRPFFFCVREKYLAVVLHKFGLSIDQLKEAQVVFNRVPLVILRNSAVDQPIVQKGPIVIPVAEALSRMNVAGNQAIMNFALRIRIDRKVVALAAELPQ